jgi:hypothetical protein
MESGSNLQPVNEYPPVGEAQHMTSMITLFNEMSELSILDFLAKGLRTNFIYRYDFRALLFS